MHATDPHPSANGGLPPPPPRAQIKRSLALAALLVIALVAVIVWSVRRGTPKREPARAAGAAGAAELAIPRSRPELVKGAKEKSDENPRLTYARRLNRGLRAKGHTCSVRSEGDQDRVLVISWSRESWDREHMEKLQAADGFFAQLRALGFERLVMRVSGKQVRSKKI